MEISYELVAGAIISIVIWLIKSQSERRYTEQKEINKQVDINTKNILENKEKDLASVEAFNTYKKTIEGDNKKMEKMLSEILNSLNSFKESVNNSISDLKLEIEKLKK